jgi:beta-glucosidase-like glycosyl hydrolase
MCRLITVHCLSRFFPKMTAQGATFKVHLMPHMSTKIDKNMHPNGHLTSLYPLVWVVQAY